MKKWFVISGAFLTIFLFGSCSSSLDNSITFKNLAAAPVYVNFRGDLITVPVGQNSLVKDIPKGTYDFVTTYGVPSGTTGSSTTGDVSGSLVIKPGTKILIVYSSTFVSGIYSLYATMSNSDDQSGTTGP